MSTADRPGPNRPLTARRVHAKGPRLYTSAATRRVVLLGFEDCESGRAVGFAVFTAYERPGKETARVRVEGFGAGDESRAWRAFADRVLELTQELEKVQDVGEPDPWRLPLPFPLPHPDADGNGDGNGRGRK